ncbi:hypothetical protein [Vibrio superstes]|uniref:Glycosyltransferase RgtA/B/C/D-like domain-containing protein n=1 Tax=Vibrio superstes NBRC 103154 TaxID=1219062 RepID=A0A511QVL3_9VIBR|nr:hypothetical protein [Vibrio superstes]GEM81027.1 hypothetical protein VSU01S_32720 [Vibrio superstes NBRC 103154]
MELTKPLNEKNQQLRVLAPVLILSIIFSLIMFGTFWDKVSSLDLWDDDDYMRLVQISEWVASGNWYLQPLGRLNPEDGQIIHWTRVPDIVPYILIKAFTTVTDIEMATLISISITPLLYLCITAVLIAATTSKLFGSQYAFISAVYALSSYLLIKFLPGSIDHHNVQLCITAFFILLIPIKEYEFEYKRRAWVQGMMIAISLWVGVANILFFISALSILVFYGILRNEKALKYASTISLSAFVFSLIFVILNRPYYEFFDVHVDAISIAFSFCFLSGFVFCVLYSTIYPINNSRYLSFTFSLLASLLPTLAAFPELVTDIAYRAHPEILKTHWIDLISETFSTTHYIIKNGFFSSSNIAIMLLPALFSLLFIDKKSPVINHYFIFILSLSIPFLWQDRASITPLLLAIPLQAYVAINISKKTSNNLYKALIILILSPVFIGGVLDIAPKTNNQELLEKTNLTEHTTKSKRLEHLFSEINFDNEKILAPIDFGTRILALTKANIVSLPYHRNIKGNSNMIEIFISTNLDYVKKEIINNKITHIIIGDAQQSKVLKILSSENSFINKLDRGELPPWLLRIYKQNGLRVFKIKERTEGVTHE